MAHSFPNRLFDQGRSVLAKFGFRHAAADRTDWAEMWAALAGDFALRGLPPYDRLSPPQQNAAREYMRRRLLADRNLDACEELHYALYDNGIDTELVERYALAREVYEDSVEDFGRARERLDAMLPR